MARINTKVGLINYVKSQLGAPTINIEVTDEQIGQIIDDTVQKFTEYAYGTLEETILVQINGRGSYQMPDAMTNLVKMSKGATSNLTNFSANFGAGYVPDLWSQQYFSNSLTGDIIPAIIGISNTKAMLDKYFGDEIVFNFNYLNKQLKILENYVGPAVIHYQYEYLANEDNDLVYNHEWIKNYTKAKTKDLWSMVTGKYTQQLIGGGSINFDKMASEAQTSIEKLDEELLNKWADPAPIDIA